MSRFMLTGFIMLMYGLVYAAYYGGQAAILTNGKENTLPELAAIFHIGWFIFLLSISILLEFLIVIFEEKVKGVYP